MFINSKLAFTLALSASFATLQSCAVRRQGQAQMKFAISPSDKVLGSPMARIEIVKMGFTVKDEPFHVCVEKPPVNTVNEIIFLVQVKLAYTQWLLSAGYDKVDWERFKFELADKCDPADKAQSMAVRIATMQFVANDPDLKERFRSIGFMYSNDGTRTRCTIDAYTTGVASAGGRLTWSQTASDGKVKWVEFGQGKPAPLNLTPFVTWKGLNDEIRERSDLRESIKSHFDLLIIEAMSKDDFQSYKALAEWMQDAKLVSNIPQVFDSECDRLKHSSRTFIEKEIFERVGVHHVLLHEMGHVFGLSHADNPNGDAVTGKSSTTTVDETSKKFVTSKATMAYGDPYTYLTEDDILGVKAQRDAIVKTLLDHK
jgi:hypothetical protein